MHKLINRGDIVIGERFRQEYKNIPDLAESFKRFGILEPVIVEQVDGTYQLLAGGRRMQAAEVADLKKIPCIIKKNLSEIERKELELEENLQREDLTFVEECYAKREIDRIKKQIHGDQEMDRTRDGWSTRQTASLLGESPSGLSQDLALANAMDMFPQLKEAKNKSEAMKKFKKLVEGVAVSQLIKKAEEEGDSAFKHADSHYKIGDVVEELKKLDQTVASFAEVDPPYGVDLQKMKKAKDATLRDQYDEIDAGEYPKFIEAVTSELFRVLARDAWVVWWFSWWHYETVKAALEKAGFIVDPIPGIWVKHGTAQTNQPDIYLARGYEQFLIARKGEPLLAKRGISNVFEFSQVHPSQKIHTTERPVELIKALLDVFTLPGAMIIVPFLGSGNTLRAAYMMNRRGWGYDISPEYKEKFLARVIEDHAEQKES